MLKKAIERTDRSRGIVQTLYNKSNILTKKKLIRNHLNADTGNNLEKPHICIGNTAKHPISSQFIACLCVFT